MLNLKNQNRLDELLGTITEARKSLQDWHDKRTEALIQLDALSYDLRQIEEEKSRQNDLITALKNEIEDRAKVYQSHVESITDQMQMLKVEKDEVEGRLNEAIARIQKQLDESELERNRQAEREAEIVATWERRVAEQRNDFEVKYAEQQNFNREQVAGLNDEINTLLAKIEQLKAQLAEAEIRGERNDRELQVIRAQMMNVLRVSEGESLSEFFKPNIAAGATAAAAPIPTRHPETARIASRPANPSIISNAEALTLAAQGQTQNGAKTNKASSTKNSNDLGTVGSVSASMGPEATVEDYLKRLGYE